MQKSRAIEDKLRVVLVGDLNYEELVADIVYDNGTILIITQEEGVEKMQVNFSPMRDLGTSCSVPLDSFISILRSAKQWLIESRDLAENEADRAE